MLMKTPKSAARADDGTLEALSDTLRIPERPAAIRAARDALAAAKAERMAAQDRHHQAGALLRSQRPGEVPMITHQEVDEIGAKIAPALTTEAEAKTALDRLTAEYSSEVHACLEDPLRQYRESVAAKINELENLLALGVRLHSDSISVGIKLPSSLPGVCPHLVSHVHALRRVFSLAKR